MPGGRPDPQRIIANAQIVFGGAGETATWLAYVSATVGTPRFGLADTFSYTTALFTGLFYVRKARPTETPRQGGEVQEAQLFVAAPSALGARDQVQWRGSAYRAEGSPWPENLGGRVQWHTPLVLANPVG